jgi:hypothetical protein
LVLPRWIEYGVSWASLSINPLISSISGTQILLWNQSELKSPKRNSDGLHSSILWISSAIKGSSSRCQNIVYFRSLCLSSITLMVDILPKDWTSRHCISSLSKSMSNSFGTSLLISWVSVLFRLKASATTLAFPVYSWWQGHNP